MSAQVIELVNEQRVNDAWDAYVALASLLPDNPRLLTDRDFMAQLKRAESRWTQLFLILDAA